MVDNQVHQRNMSGTRFMVQWEEHPAHLTSRLGQLLEHQTLVDVTLMCNTHTLRVHRAVLAACSPYFETLLQSIFQRQLGQHPLIVLKDMQFSVLKSLVEFMYCGETSVSEDDLGALLQAAKFFQVKGLSSMTREVLGLSASNKNAVPIVENGRLSSEDGEGITRVAISTSAQAVQKSEPSHVSPAKPVVQQTNATDTAELLLSLSGDQQERNAKSTETLNVIHNKKLTPPSVQQLRSVVRNVRSYMTVQDSSKVNSVSQQVQDADSSVDPQAGLTLPTGSGQRIQPQFLSTNGFPIYVPGPRKRGRPLKRQMNLIFQEKVMTDAEMALRKEAEASRKALETLQKQMASNDAGNLKAVIEPSVPSVVPNSVDTSVTSSAIDNGTCSNISRLESPPVSSTSANYPGPRILSKTTKISNIESSSNQTVVVSTNRNISANKGTDEQGAQSNPRKCIISSQYAEILKEAGLPSDVPILMDSGDGSYITVNEEMLMNIVDGGMLQCQLADDGANKSAAEEPSSNVSVQFSGVPASESSRESTECVSSTTSVKDIASVSLKNELEKEEVNFLSESATLSDILESAGEELQTGGEKEYKKVEVVQQELMPIVKDVRSLKCELPDVPVNSDAVKTCTDANSPGHTEVNSSADTVSVVHQSDSGPIELDSELSVEDKHNNLEHDCSANCEENCSDEAVQQCNATSAASTEDKIPCTDVKDTMANISGDSDITTVVYETADSSDCKMEVEAASDCNEDYLVQEVSVEENDLNVLLIVEEEDADKSGDQRIISVPNIDSTEAKSKSTVVPSDDRIRCKSSVEESNAEHAKTSHGDDKENEECDTVVSCSTSRSLNSNSNTRDRQVERSVSSTMKEPNNKSSELSCSVNLETEAATNHPPMLEDEKEEHILTKELDPESVCANTDTHVVTEMEAPGASNNLKPIDITASDVTAQLTNSKPATSSPTKDIPFAVGLLPLRTALEKLQSIPDHQPRKTRSGGKASAEDGCNLAPVKRKSVVTEEEVQEKKLRASEDESEMEHEDKHNEKDAEERTETQSVESTILEDKSELDFEENLCDQQCTTTVSVVAEKNDVTDSLPVAVQADASFEEESSNCFVVPADMQQNQTEDMEVSKTLTPSVV